MFRVMGSVDVPRTGFVVAANLQHFSGKPWAATAQVVAAAGRQQRILLEPRGSRRLSSQIAARSARVEDDSRSGGVGRIELLLDVLNVLNDTAEEGLATDNLFSANFGQPTRVHGSAPRDGRRQAEPGPVMAASADRYFGRSIRTMSEFSRERSKTMCLPSGVMSNVRTRPDC